MPTSLRSAFALVGLALALVAGLPALAQEAGRAPAPLGDPIPPFEFRLPSDEADDREAWREDPERVREGTRRQLSPDAYMEALEQLGLLDHLRERALRPADKATGAWERMGPVGGFGGPQQNGRIAGLQLVADPSVFYRIYAGTCQGGLWRTDGVAFGQWVDIGRNLPNPSVRAFWVDPDDFRHIIVGTGDFLRYVGAGMFRTTDEGLTWDPVASPFPSTPDYYYRMLDLGIDPGTGQRRLVAVCSYGPIFSDDNGATWQRSTDTSGSLFGKPFTDVVAHPDDPSLLYAPRCDDDAAGDSGIWVSQDYGETWARQNVPNFPPPESWRRASLAISRSNPSTLAVLISDQSKLQAVFRTENAGATWVDVTNNLTWADGSFGGGQVGHAQAIAIDPTNHSRMYLGAVELAVTGNKGASWNMGQGQNGIAIGHADITQLRFDTLSGDDIMWICNDGGLYFHRLSTASTYDGQGNASTGLACSEVDYLDIEREMVAIGLQDNGTLISRTGGQTWEYIEGGDGADAEIFDPIQGHIFYNNGVYAAPAWRTYRLRYGNPRENTNAPEVYMPRLHYSPFSRKLYTHDQTGLYSLDAWGALAWSPLTANWQTLPYQTRSMFSSWGRDPAFWFVYWKDSRTTNDGDEDLTYVYWSGGGWQVKHWEDFNPSNQAVLTVTPSREWPDEAWVGVDGNPGNPKIYHLRNGGDIKEDITGTLTNVNYVRSIAVMPFDPDVVWVGTDLGVFQTTDGGANWAPFMDGLPIGRCTEMHFDVDHTHGGPHYLYVAMDGRGVWRREITLPPIYYVDGSVAASGDGTIWGGPLKTVAEAVAVAPAGAIIALRADSYQEPQRLSGGVRVVTWQGASRVH